MKTFEELLKEMPVRDARLVSSCDGALFLSGEGRRVLVSFASLPLRLDFLDKILDAMSALVMDIFPDRPTEKNSPAWFAGARKKIIEGKSLILDVPYEENLREFSLLVGDEFALMLAIKCKKPSDDDVDFFMNKARWLAECANARVLVAFNPRGTMDEFVGVLLPGSPPDVWSNVAGQNFFSLVERQLWEKIEKDETISGKFATNMPFRTVFGREIMPDFFCSELMLSVEVDGYTYHCGRKHFISDRQRDYEMLLSGCTTLRIPAKEILTDAEGAARKVRNVFHFLKNRRI